jgi:hypothetical protein
VKLQRPQLKRPQLKRPQIRAPKLKGPEVKAPRFLTDVFRDLRDRHLLVPVVALLAALVAVPVLLKSTSEPAPPAPPAAGSELDGAATQPAVLAEDVTVRDYRDRLEALKAKNPFRERFSSPKLGSGEQIAGLQDTSPTGSPTGTTGSPTGTTGTTGMTSDTSGSTAVGTTPSSGDGSGNTSSSPPTHTTTRYFTRRIDVLVGVQGAEKERNGIDAITFLPSESKPVVAFIGTRDSGGKAVFAVSDDVASTSGEGSCAPSSSNCQYLTLHEGQARTFDYTPDGRTYRLKLREIRVVKLDKAPGVSGP